MRKATPQSVNSITRDDLHAYAMKYWRPDLTSIAVVGNLSPERVRTALEAAFGSWQAAGPKPEIPEPVMPRPDFARSTHDRFAETDADAPDARHLRAVVGRRADNGRAGERRRRERRGGGQRRDERGGSSNGSASWVHP